MGLPVSSRGAGSARGVGVPGVTPGGRSRLARRRAHQREDGCALECCSDTSPQGVASGPRETYISPGRLSFLPVKQG